MTLHAVFQDGHEVAGESSIAQYDGMIERVYVTNTYNDEEPKASRKVVDAIMNSDMIVLGPGSLYTSILPNLVIPEIRQALIETKADVTYICNIMTQYGETEQFSDADHVAVLNRHLGSDVIDNVLVNIKKVPKEYMLVINLMNTLFRLSMILRAYVVKLKQLCLLIFCDLKMVVPSTW